MKQRKGKGFKDFLKHSAERSPIALVVVLPDVEDLMNVDAAFRIAEACDADKMPLGVEIQSA